MPDDTIQTTDLVTPFYQYLLAIAIASKRATRAREAADAEFSVLEPLRSEHATTAKLVVAEYLMSVYADAFVDAVHETLATFFVRTPNEHTACDLAVLCGPAGAQLMSDRDNGLITPYQYHIKLITITTNILQNNSQ